MAEITDPIVVTFSNDYMRPLSERLRNLQLLLTDAKTEYTTVVQPVLVPYAAGDVLNDGRAAEGVYAPTKQEMTDLLVHINAVLAELDTVGQAELRAKFSVRPPVNL